MDKSVSSWEMLIEQSRARIPDQESKYGGAGDCLSSKGGWGVEKGEVNQFKSDDKNAVCKRSLFFQ